MDKRGRGERLTDIEKASIRRRVLVDGMDHEKVCKLFGAAEVTVRRVCLIDGTCTKCLKNPSEPGRKRCANCIPSADRSWRKSNKKSKMREVENKKNGLCGCGNTPEFGFRKCSECRFERQSGIKKRRLRLRAEAIKAYGSECYCCGEDNPRLLTIDHVNNDGHAMRKVSRLHRDDIYKVVKREGYPTTYRLACYTCNLGRDKEPDKVCPHQKEPFHRGNMKMFTLGQYAALA